MGNARGHVTAWQESQGSTVECRLPIYAEGLPADSSLLIVRAPLLASERLHCVATLDGEPVIRGCWNSPHREGGSEYLAPSHGHRYRQGRRMTYVPDAPLEVIPMDGVGADWTRRASVHSFLMWAQIAHDGLIWQDPPYGGGVLR